MRIHRAKWIVIVAAASIVATVGVAVAVAREDASGPTSTPSADPALSRVSSPGRPITLAPGVIEKLHLDAWSEISLLATKGTRHFYRFERPAGNPCFGTGRTDAPYPIGMISCRIAAPFFPSPEMPVLDLSVVSIEKGDTARFTRVQGIAADGVARVGILDADGNVAAEIPVENNVYSSDSVPRDTTAALVAVGADGRILAAVPK
jgi:hypothetical protein